MSPNSMSYGQERPSVCWSTYLIHGSEIVNKLSGRERDAQQHNLDDETSRSPTAVVRGRRSGQARATILRNEVDAGIDPSVLAAMED
jgi:hypothetical protein